MNKLFNKWEASLTYPPFVLVSGLCMLVSLIGEYAMPFFGSGEKNVLMVNFAWVAIVLSGVPLLITAVKRIVVGWISSPLLISIAMIAAIYIGDIFAAGEVAFIMAIGAWIEDKTVEKTKRGLRDLLNLVPKTGRRITLLPYGVVKEEDIRAEDLQVGDLIRILPGESFAADGVIVKGETSVDQSIMTGESLPVDKAFGDEVFSGTINRFGSVDVEVTKAFTDSSLQKMIELVNEAEKNKAPTEKLADKWSRWLVPVALLIAIGAYVFSNGTYGHQEALIRAVTVLVVFCPCALVLATPTSVVAAIGQATKYGVLIKSGAALENMGKITTVAFDKTGTLTHGRLVVSDIIPYEITEAELLSLAGSVEGRSEHPLGKAILSYAKEQSANVLEISDFVMTVGKGVTATVGSRKIICGNEKLIAEESAAQIDESISKEIDNLRSQGKAVIIVSDENDILGLLAMSDTIKESSPQAIEMLEAAGITKTILLTGDNEMTADYVAKNVGITDVISSLLPEGKVAAIKNLVEQNHSIAMVGDGVNDAPALKAASVGIAMGSMGSDIAIEAADIALMGDDITKISYVKKLSVGMVNSIKFNIMLSLVINAFAVYLSVTGVLVPATAALVHNVGSIFVVVNAGRLYSKKFD